MTRYQDIRLSKHFVLMDFMNDRDLYMGGLPLPLSFVTDEHLEMGRSLCEHLLEPLISRYGPCSLAAGLCFSGPGPHQWLHREGSAVDIAFHDWVGLDRPPIKLVEDMIAAGIDFERVITYAGSEYICMAWSRSKRFALYENVRIPGNAKPNFVQLSRHPGEFRKLTKTFPDRPDWRRAPNEVVYHTRRSLRPQHIRLGRYFSMLDMCRSELGLQVGEPWVLPIQASQQAMYGRMMAEVLEPVVTEFGRVSVVQGVVPPKLAARMGRSSELYRWLEGNASLDFLLPEGSDGAKAVEILSSHASVVDVAIEDHPSNTSIIKLTISPFMPRTIWSGGYPFGYYSGHVPDHLPARIRARLKQE